MPNIKTFAQEAVATPNKASVLFESAVDRLASRERSGSRSRSFPHFLLSPIHYEPKYAYPLIVWLHDAEKTEAELFDVAPKISNRNYVAVAPRGLARPKTRIVRERQQDGAVSEKRWVESCFDWPETESGVSEAENLVFDSIDRAFDNFNVERRRVFLIGRGAGGTMALRVALRNPREFAGVVSIDGAFPTLDYLPLRNWRNVRELPILTTTGSARSRVVPQITAAQLRLFHTAGMTVVVRQYNDAANGPNAAETRMKKILVDVNRWTMERALNANAPVSNLFERR